MKRYQQSAKGRAVNRTAKKKYNESPKGRATLQALRERNKEHQKAYRESPRAGHGLRSRMENKACRANKTVWFLSPSSSPIWTGRSEHEHRNLRHPQRGPLT